MPKLTSLLKASAASIWLALPAQAFTVEAHDVVFLVDESGSHFFNDTWQAQVSLFFDLLSGATADPDGNRYALATFGTTVSTLLSLDDPDSFDPAAVTAALSGHAPAYTLTHTRDALGAAISEYRSFDRDAAPNIVVLLTDGKPFAGSRNTGQEVCSFAPSGFVNFESDELQELQALGVEFYVGFTGDGTVFDGVACLTQPDKIFSITEFGSQARSDLVAILHTVPAPAPIPLPASALLLAGALGGLTTVRRRST